MKRKSTEPVVERLMTAEEREALRVERAAQLRALSKERAERQARLRWVQGCLYLQSEDIHKRL